MYYAFKDTYTKEIYISTEDKIGKEIAVVNSAIGYGSRVLFLVSIYKGRACRLIQNVAALEPIATDTSLQGIIDATRNDFIIDVNYMKDMMARTHKLNYDRLLTESHNNVDGDLVSKVATRINSIYNGSDVMAPELLDLVVPQDQGGSDAN